MCQQRLYLHDCKLNHVQRIVSGYVGIYNQSYRASKLVLVVKNPRASAWNTTDVGLIPGPGSPLEAGMATHSSILVWRIPWTDKPGGIQSKGLERVGHNWSDLLCTHTLTPPSLRKHFVESVAQRKNLSWIKKEVNPGVDLLNSETANEIDTSISYESQLYWWPPINHTY